MRQATQPVPKRIEGLQAGRAVAISTRSMHSLVLAGGAVFSFGGNVSGRLGHGDESYQPSPSEIEALRGAGVHAVCAGASSLAASRDKVYGFGETCGFAPELGAAAHTPVPLVGIKIRGP